MVREGDHDLDLVTLRMRCHCRIDASTNCVRGGARVGSPIFMSILINDDGLTAAVSSPVLDLYCSDTKATIAPTHR
jgi:hypothetical protein